MSNAIIVPASFGGPVAAAFQGQQAGDDLSGGITGGYGLLKIRGKVWSIQYNGATQNLMREDGDGPRGSVDIVILKANAHLSKTWYENGWDENSNNPPDCASANGIVPDAGVPKQQSNVCATCPRNAWGSAPNGGKGKACGDHRRLAVVPLLDLRNETYGGPLLLRCPAASLQDMAAFDSRYKGMGYPYFSMGIKVGFDPAESYPKLTFAAIRPLTDQEAVVVLEMRNSPEVARVISEGTAPAPAAVAAPPAGAFLEQAPVQQPVQQQAAPQVQVQPAPAQPAPAPVTQPAHNAPVATTAAVSPAPAQGGFGPTAPADTAQQPAAAPAAVVSQPAPAPAVTPAPASAPQAQQPAQSAPKMTGFGPVTPEVTPAPVQQAAQQPVQQAAQPPQQAAPVEAAPPGPAPAVTAQTAPGVVSAFEGSLDERLNALLGDTATSQ